MRDTITVTTCKAMSRMCRAPATPRQNRHFCRPLPRRGPFTCAVASLGAPTSGDDLYTCALSALRLRPTPPEPEADANADHKHVREQLSSSKPSP
jgi:hypothetical protein